MTELLFKSDPDLQGRFLKIYEQLKNKNRLKKYKLTPVRDLSNYDFVKDSENLINSKGIPSYENMKTPEIIELVEKYVAKNLF